ncbi:MAG: tripartite tricarboxylate transporter substrate binding protein [Burkholderiales bacterium]|nr:tripartite tricarboxylate transporter substrate binding protein [Burkholderiales bacterium]
MKRLLALLVLGMGLPLVAGAQAQKFPSKPTRIVVPFVPGGSSDILARLISANLKDAWGQAPLVENRPGASGAIGADAVAKAAPDGHTLIVTDLGTMAILPTLAKNLSFDLHKDLQTVTIISFSPYMVVVSPKHPAKSLAELLAYSKANPGKLNVATAGIGSNPHLASLQFSKAVGLDWVFVPSKGGAQAIVDVAGGHADALFNSMLATAPHVKNGSVRLLAIAAPKRDPAYPDTPILGETVPGFVAGSWQGIFTTGGTPRDVVQRLHADLVKVLAAPDMQGRIAGMGAEPIANSPDEFDKWLRGERERWAKVIRDNNLKID